MNLKIQKATTAKDYISLDESERTTRKWFWPFRWYTPPYAMEFNMDDFRNGDSEFNKVDKFLKKEYPIQFFLRETIKDFAETIWRKLTYKLYNPYHEGDLQKFWYRHFSHRNKWAHEAISYDSYSDIDGLMEKFLFACITSYVSKGGEDAFNVINWDDNETHKAIKERIIKVHNYIAKVRPYLQKREKSGYDFADKNRHLPFKEQYRYVHFYEEMIRNADEKYMIEIVKLREYLWT